jgi:cobalamin-dependent methionine synthase I
MFPNPQSQRHHPRPEENISLEDMLKVKYQGIRPAPGYPSQPDHREKKTLPGPRRCEQIRARLSIYQQNIAKL